MTQANIELLHALREAGASEEAAEAAARSVAGAGDRGDLATKADVHAAVSASEARLVRWGTVLVLGANALLFAALRLTA